MRPPTHFERGCLNTLSVGSRYSSAIMNSPNRDKATEELKIFSDPRVETSMLYIEASFTLLYQYRNAKSKTCLVVAACSFFSTVTGKSATGSILRMIDQFADDMMSDMPFWQGSENTWLDTFDALYKNIDRAKKSVLGNKVIKVFNHIIAHAFYTKIGVEVDPKLFSQLEQKKIRPKVWDCLSFADAVVGLLLFLAKAGRQALATGSIESFFIDEVVVTRFLDEAAALRKDAEFISNPSAIGMTVPVYIAKLESCIDDGKKLSKVFKLGTQHTVIHSVILELELILKRHSSSMVAASFRRAPFGLFLYGNAGIAKSFIAAGLFNHYCSVRNIAKEQAVCWTRDDNDPFYSGYKSHFAGVLFDDAGKFRPNVVQGVDPSIKDIISAINNIPFITNQAELQDKGKIPFLSEWVGVTSNMHDLNADMYYNSSGAFMRRLKVRITPTVKPEYRIPGEERIDETKIPSGVQYPDLWTFEVALPVVEGLKGRFEPKHTFSHYSDLLVYLASLYKKHIDNQDRLMLTTTAMGPETLCECGAPSSICICANADSEVLSGDPSSVKAQAGILCRPMSDDERDRFLTDGNLELAIKAKVRVGMCCVLRDKMSRKYHALKGADAAYFKQFWDEDYYSKYFDATYYGEEPNEDVVEFLETELDKSIASFQKLSPHEKLSVLTEIDFDSSEIEQVYLTFTPRRGKPCSFLVEHLESVRKTVLAFVDKDFDDAELAVLDNYIYQEAPRNISEGWPMADIVRGGLDYVKHYKTAITEPGMYSRDALAEVTQPHTYTERVGLWFAVQYFEHATFRSCVNFLYSYRATQWVVSSIVAQKAAAAGSIVVSAGKAYDATLGGDNKHLKLFLGVISLAGFMALVYKMYTRFCSESDEIKPHMFNDGEIHRCVITQQPVFMCRCDLHNDGSWAKPGVGCNPEDIKPVCTWCGELASRHRNDCTAQMDLNAVGKLPVPREVEKKNIWTVTERAITKLDVDHKVPHNVTQAYNAIRKNLCYVEVRCIHDGKQAVLTSRALVIDSETIVMNNHMVTDKCHLTIWVGPKTVDGVQPSIKIYVVPEMLQRNPARDLVVIKTWSLPCLFKKITHLFPKRSFQSVGPATYFMKNEDGTITEVSAVGARPARLSNMTGAPEADMMAWRTTPSRPTVSGECGSPLVIDTPIGCVIVGFHCGYSAMSNTAWAAPLFYEDFEDKKVVTVGHLNPDGTVAQFKTCYEDLKPTDKLFTDYHETGHMLVHGQLRGFRARHNFTGGPTPFFEHVLREGAGFNPPILDRLARPRTNAWQAPQQVLANYLHPTHSMNEKVLRACVQAFCGHIKKNLKPEDWADIHPVPLNVAVNGFPGVANLDAMKVTTSGGHGHRGPKVKFMTSPIVHEHWDHFRELGEVVTEEVNVMREAAREGIRPHAIYTTVIKDEMLSKAKVAANKARCIHCVPTAFLANMRMSVMAMCRVMVRLRDVFGIAVGLNTHSEEWHELLRLAMRIAGGNWVAGDFAAFEAVLSILISNAVCKILIFMAVESGNYDDDEIMVLKTLLADTVNPTLDFFGLLVSLIGGEASGHQLTTFFNCLANQLLHMYAYVIIHIGMDGTFDQCVKVAAEFFEKVFRNTLGDDVYLKVSPDRSKYNHTSIQNVFATMGITYTMADKLAESRPYISLEEVTFLKRSWADHSAFPGMKVATLAKESIYKMLLYTLPSKSVTIEEQMASAIQSAVAEAFFHDREFYDQIVCLVQGLPKTPELVARMRELPPPTWNQMIHRFVSASPKMQAQLIVPGYDAETMETEDSYCHSADFEYQAKWSVDPWGSTTMGRSPEECIYTGIRLSPKRAHKRAAIEKKPCVENQLFSKNTHKNPTTHFGPKVEMTHPETEKVIRKVSNATRKKEKTKAWKNRTVAQGRFECEGRPMALSNSLSSFDYDEWYRHHPHFEKTLLPKQRPPVACECRCVVQSDISYDLAAVPGAGGDMQTQQQQTTQFVHEPVGQHVDITQSVNPTTRAMSLPYGLSEYLSRPQLIATYPWVENTANGNKFQFFPWSAFFGSTAMSNKLQGFSLLRANLHLKFLVNGSPFYYGALMAAYTPLSGWRPDTAQAVSLSNTLVATSQKPHVWLNNQDVSTAELTLPFLYPYPYIDIALATRLTNMGDVRLVQYAPLLSANGSSSTSVDIQVYAWATDVELGGPTNVVVAQSKVSEVASAVEGVANTLSSVPILGSYASSVAQVSGVVSSVAGYFGFTNEPVTDDVTPMKQVPFQLASSEISEPVMKLGLQPKQSISVGGAQFGGSEEDDLAISRFVERTSFIVGSAWDTTLTPGTALFSTHVCPGMFQLVGTQVAHSPLSYISKLFQYWRGDIKFTFKVVRSPYHKGRLQVLWDRGARNLNQSATLGNPNTLAWVVDLDEEDEVTITVPFSQERQFLETQADVLSGGLPQAVNWSTANPPPNQGFGNGNGVLTVRVMNRLTAPEASSTATLLVSVSAADNFSFAGPKEVSNEFEGSYVGLSVLTAAVVQSKVEYDDATEQKTAMQSSESEHVFQEVFGENIVSLRELLHRSSLSRLWFSTTNSLNAATSFRLPIKRIPPIAGVINNGWDTGTTSSGPGQRVNYAKFHPIHLVASCFAGYKGSVNVAINYDQAQGGQGFLDTLSVVRMSEGTYLTSTSRRPNNTSFLANAPNIGNAALNRSAWSGSSGMALTNTRTNTGLVVNLPYYSSAGFQLWNPYTEYSNQDSLCDANNDWWQIEARVMQASNTPACVHTTALYYGTGPDFDVVFFVNVPVLTSVGIVAT